MEPKNEFTPPIKLKGTLMPTQTERHISDFVTVDDSETPGNVGVCFSGGGSVAMTSALGQMRALVEMGLLQKARAVSTVSGGSWATVPFIYLPDDISDETFLSSYVYDLGTLTTDSSPAPTSLNYAPKGYMGSAVADPAISAKSMTVEALSLLNTFSKFPNRYVWNYLIAKHILQPFGLAETDVNDEGNFIGTKKNNIRQAWFAYSEEKAQEIIAQNPELKEVPYHVYQSQDGYGDRVRRPYHLCNTAMFIEANQTSNQRDKNEKVRMLASVQCTAIGTGIFANDLGVPFNAATDSQKKQVGGGLVSSHAFNSSIDGVSGETVDVTVNSGELFSLTDITANSSAFYASMLPGLASYINMDPSYNYWPVEGAAPGESVLNQFADGGAIDNNGLLNLLAYDDIKKALVFTNALSSVLVDGKLENDEYWNVVVDTWLPPYFGYTPYQAEAKDGLIKGYNLYEELDDQSYDYSQSGVRYFRNNQIFPSNMFHDVLRAIWTNCCNGNPGDPKSAYTGVSYYHNTSMPVSENKWFGINARTIEFLLVHYGPYQGFNDALSNAATGVLNQSIKDNKDGHKKYKGNPAHEKFPNFILTHTHIPTEEMNLFAHFTAHVAMTLKDKIAGMFTS